MRREQNIAADGGYAYGTVDGDVHAVDQAALRHHFVTVPISAREAQVDPAMSRAWEDWLLGTPPLAIRWLHGVEHRVAEAMAHVVGVCARLPWEVIAATCDVDAIEETGREDRPESVLLVVADADRWSLSDLAWLLSDGRLQARRGCVRVLLLAGDDERWPGVRASLCRVQASLSSREA